MSCADTVLEHHNIVTKNVIMKNPVNVAVSSSSQQSSTDIPQVGSSKTSCPPDVDRSIVSGSWSLEWLNDHNLRRCKCYFSTGKNFREK